jgi:L-amino acid N-acyltransferase YncA
MLTRTNMAARIRMADEGDAEAVAGIYRPFVDETAVSFEIEAPNTDQIAGRISETIASYPWLVCSVDDRIVGYAYANRHRARAAYQWSVDTSVYVEANYWRYGVGRGLYTSLFRILTAQGLFNAFAGITLPNAGSVALHESMGFKPIGTYVRVGFKCGEWHDVGWWQLMLNAHDALPAAPLHLTALRQSPGWESLLAAGEPLIRIRTA